MLQFSATDPNTKEWPVMVIINQLLKCVWNCTENVVGHMKNNVRQRQTYIRSVHNPI